MAESVNEDQAVSQQRTKPMYDLFVNEYMEIREHDMEEELIEAIEETDPDHEAEQMMNNYEGEIE